MSFNVKKFEENLWCFSVLIINHRYTFFVRNECEDFSLNLIGGCGIVSSVYQLDFINVKFAALGESNLFKQWAKHVLMTSHFRIFSLIPLCNKTNDVLSFYNVHKMLVVWIQKSCAHELISYEQIINYVFILWIFHSLPLFSFPFFPHTLH